jgi:hypothetical protein
MASVGRPPKPIEQKIRAGNVGKRKLPTLTAVTSLPSPMRVPEPHRPLMGNQEWWTWCRSGVVAMIWESGCSWLRPECDTELVMLVCEQTDERTILRDKMFRVGIDWRDRAGLRMLEKQIANNLAQLGSRLLTVRDLETLQSEPMHFRSSVPKSNLSVLKPDKVWSPTFFTPRLLPQSDGDLVASFGAEWLYTSKGVRAGEPLIFTDWQRWLFNALLERRADNRLRFRRAYIGLPRKQGKSLMGSTLALYGLFAGEAGAEVYSCAGDSQQARIVFNEAKQQIQNSELLSAECNVYRDVIEVPRFNAIYRVCPAMGNFSKG